jgi:hypothetical protein
MFCYNYDIYTEEYSGEVEINDYMLLCTKTERLKMDKRLGFFGSNLF